jgi:hypothetical protein
MAIIRFPLSPGSGWQEVSIYRDYADRARLNLVEDRYFETIVICCIGLDVLLNALPDRLVLFSADKLTDCQKRCSVAFNLFFPPLVQLLAGLK